MSASVRKTWVNRLAADRLEMLRNIAVLRAKPGPFVSCSSSGREAQGCRPDRSGEESFLDGADAKRRPCDG
jgi:hypothetical protein